MFITWCNKGTPWASVNIRRCRKFVVGFGFWLYDWTKGSRRQEFAVGGYYQGVGAILYWRSIVYTSGAGVQSGDNSCPDLYIWHL